MSDLDKFTEFMSREIPVPKKPPVKTKGGEKGEKGEKGWGKNSKGKYNRYQPYNYSRRGWQQDTKADYQRDDQWRSSESKHEWRQPDHSQK